MTKKLVSLTLILIAALLALSLPVHGHGGGGSASSYNTTLTLSCFPGSIDGTLTLSNKSKALGFPLSCSASGVAQTATSIVNTTFSPTTWTFAANGCYDSKGSPMASLSASVASQKAYACYPAGGAKVGSVISSGNVGAGKPAAQ
jgi:hypothetical protein